MLKKEDLEKIVRFCKSGDYLFMSPFIVSHRNIYLYGYRVYAEDSGNRGELCGPDWVYKRRDVRTIISMLGTTNTRIERWNHDKSFIIARHVSAIKDGDFESIREKQDIRERYRSVSMNPLFV